jgi:hypothetical protein
MNLGKAYRTIPKPDLRNSFPLSPAALAESLSQYRKNANPATNRNCLRLMNFADDFKVHG